MPERDQPNESDTSLIDAILARRPRSAGSADDLAPESAGDAWELLEEVTDTDDATWTEGDEEEWGDDEDEAWDEDEEWEDEDEAWEDEDEEEDDEWEEEDEEWGEEDEYFDEDEEVDDEE